MFARLLAKIADLALPPARARFKFAMRGGIVRLTGDELIVGHGVLGSRDLRRVALRAITAIEEIPGLMPTAGVTLVVSTPDQRLTIAGLTPLAVRRFQTMVKLLATAPDSPTAD